MSETGPGLGAGLVIVDKSAGMTSHDVVSRCRRIFATRRVGHAGTLDPMATGVLVLGIERATKILGLLTATSKSSASSRTTPSRACATNSKTSPSPRIWTAGSPCYARTTAVRGLLGPSELASWSMGLVRIPLQWTFL